MGWWVADSEGNSFAVDEGTLAWGDGPADIMGQAIDDITSEFQKAWNRRPTLAELQSGLLFSARVSLDLGDDGGES